MSRVRCFAIPDTPYGFYTIQISTSNRFDQLFFVTWHELSVYMAIQPFDLARFGLPYYPEPPTQAVAELFYQPVHVKEKPQVKLNWRKWPDGDARRGMQSEQFNQCLMDSRMEVPFR